MWKTGIVEKLNFGDDGLVRSAIMRTNTGITSRRITKLYPLEVNQNDKFPIEALTVETTKNQDDDENLRFPPVRQSAIKAKRKSNFGLKGSRGLIVICLRFKVLIVKFYLVQRNNFLNLNFCNFIQSLRFYFRGPENAVNIAGH